MTRPLTPAALLVPVAGLALVLAAGAAHRQQTAALRDPAVLAAAADRLGDLPAAVGGWTSTPLELDADQLRVAEASGGVVRRYTGPNGEGPVEVMLLAGPQGPISVHPPTVCFRGAGYSQCAPVRRESVGRSAEMAATEFEKVVEGRPVRIRTLWGWGADGSWSAPDEPRVAFAAEPFLYKLYVTEFRPAAGTAGVADAPLPATEAFLGGFLPALADALGGGESAAPAAAS